MSIDTGDLEHSNLMAIALKKMSPPPPGKPLITNSSRVELETTSLSVRECWGGGQSHSGNPSC